MECHTIPITIRPNRWRFGVAFRDRNFAVVVGGNFQDSTRQDSVACMTTDGGIRWGNNSGNRGPSGYRSCVTWHPGWGCGLPLGEPVLTGARMESNGTLSGDLSGYYVCMPSNDALWCVGRNGKACRLLYMAPQ